MGGRRVLTAAAVLVTVLGLCILAYGALTVIGSTSRSGSASWLSYGIGFAAGGILLLAAGAGMAYAAQRGQRTTVVQQLKLDLPGNSSMAAVSCRSCGGSIKPENVSMVAGAPMVKCPYCGTSYQLSEEPKW